MTEDNDEWACLDHITASRACAVNRESEKMTTCANMNDTREVAWKKKYIVAVYEVCGQYTETESGRLMRIAREFDNEEAAVKFYNRMDHLIEFVFNINELVDKYALEGELRDEVVDEDRIAERGRIVAELWDDYAPAYYNYGLKLEIPERTEPKVKWL